MGKKTLMKTDKTIISNIPHKKISKSSEKTSSILKNLLKIRKFKKVLSLGKKLKKKQDSVVLNDYENESISTFEENENLEGNKEIEKKTNENLLISATLSKFWKTCYELPAIYTGGKIMFSSRYRQILSISNFMIFVYDFEKKELIRKITHDNEEISNFALNQQETILMTFTKNYLLRIMDYRLNEITKTIKLVDNSFALEMVFDPAGRFLAMGTPQGIFKVFDVKKGIQTHELKGHRGAIKQLFFHPDFQKYEILSISEEGMIKKFDMVVNACINTKNTNIAFSALALSGDGAQLFGYDNLKIYIFDTQNLQNIKSFATPEDFLTIQQIKLNDELFLFGGGEFGTLKYLNLSKDSETFLDYSAIRNPNIMNILTIRNKNRNHIALITGEQNIVILEPNLIDSKLELTEIDTVIGFNDEIIDLKYIKISNKKKINKKDIICMATNSNMIKIFDKKDKKFSMFLAHSDTVLSLDVIDDLMVSSSKDKTIKLWQMKENDNKTFSYHLIATFKGHLESIGCVALAPKTTSIFISGSSDQSIKVWSVKNAMKTYQKQKKFSNKTKNSIVIANALRSIPAHEKDINALKFSPNEKLFASASQDKTIKVWDSVAFSAKFILKGHRRGVWDISFSPVEKILASGSGDSMIKIWNLVDGTCLNTLEGHNGSVLKINWICFGLEIVSGSSDGLIKVWNYKKGVCMNTFEKHEGKVWAFDVSEPKENGKQEMISGGNDSLFCIWEDITSENEKKIQEEAHTVIVEQQNISNALRNKDFYEAGRIAFRHGMVKNFQTALELIFNEIEFKNEIIYSEMETLVTNDQNENISKFEENFKAFLKEIIEIDINKLLVFIRDMNSTAKHCKIAQRVLNYLFRIISIDKFLEFRKKFEIKQKKIKKISNDENQKKKKEFDELIEIMISYSEKHLNRTQNYIKKSFYLDFMLEKLNLFNNKTSEN